MISFPALKGCLSGGETLEEAHATDAEREWLIEALKRQYDIPVPDDA